MNIGIFTDSYHPYTSGVVRSIEVFTKELEILGHNVYIFGPDYPNCEPEKGVYRFLSIPAPTQPDFTIAIPISTQLGNRITTLALDIIHVQSPFIMGRLGAKAAEKYGIPLVFTFHTLYDQYLHYVPVPQTISRWVVHNVGRDFCNRCNLVITPTQSVQKYLTLLGVETPIETIPTGIELDEFTFSDNEWLRNEYHINPKDKVLLCVCRLCIEKNVNFVLDAFSGINKKYPDTCLVLVGGGPLRKELEHHVKNMQLSDKVIFTGTLPRNKVVNAYSGADLFLYASTSETQGLVILEAKAGGLPIVAVSSTGVSEMVVEEEDGFLVTEEQEAFINTACYLLKNDNLRKEMGIKAKENAAKLSSAKCTEKLVEAYRETIRTKYASLA